MSDESPARSTARTATSPDRAGPADPALQAALAAWTTLVRRLAGQPLMRVSRDGGRTYPRRHEQPLSADNPRQPATIPVYDPADRSGRLLAADFDVSRSPSPGDRAGQVAAEAADFTRLVARAGGRVITDISPSGGRHVLVAFGQSLPWQDLRDLSLALTRRYATLDPAPMAGPGGQIRPPGARHRSGGWQSLTMPLSEAAAALACPCGPEVWNGLLREFAAELEAVEPVAAPGDAPPGAVADDDGTPWLPRMGGRRPLAAEYAAIARTGTWPRGRYAGRSQARMAVITAAAASGWRLADVRAELAAGHWPGLADLYTRTREPRRLERLLPAEWRKSVTWIAREENPRNGHTSDGNSRPPALGTRLGQIDLEPEYGLIRMWITATDCAICDPRRLARWGRQAITIRLVLAAIAQAAMVSGSSVIEFGIRNLALHAGVSARTAARVLQLLRDEPDPLVDLVSRHHLRRADRYQLRIPDCYAASARWRRRRAGRIEAIHHTFLVLGGAAALVYAALGPAEAHGAEIARAARLGETATAAALKTLAEHGLAEHGRHGWHRGPVTLADAADACGATRQYKERQAAYSAERSTWRSLIASWLAPPDIRYSDNDLAIPIDDILAFLEPPEWLDADPGPPPGYTRSPAARP